MGTEHRLACIAAGLVTGLLLALGAPGTAHAAAPWWQRVALEGTRVTAVAAAGRTVVVQTPSRVLRSSDGGATFQPLMARTSVASSLPLISDGVAWTITADGRVLRSDVHGGRPLRFTPEPRAPNLGAGAHLLAAPAALPGVVVAVATDNILWRRARDGSWAEALVLLPSGFPHGAPPVTALAAFTTPLTDAVYVATDGYAVLLSTDGGDDWIRAGPGLPDHVLSLAADSSARELWAGTDDGLFVHHLASFPAPPVYRDAALVGRWAGIIAVSVVAALLAGTALLFGIRRLA